LEHPQYGQSLKLIFRIFSFWTDCGARIDLDAVVVPVVFGLVRN
jgi:hypothetical protein